MPASSDFSHINDEHFSGTPGRQPSYKCPPWQGNRNDNSDMIWGSIHKHLVGWFQVDGSLLLKLLKAILALFTTHWITHLVDTTGISVLA